MNSAWCGRVWADCPTSPSARGRCLPSRVSQTPWAAPRAIQNRVPLCPASKWGVVEFHNSPLVRGGKLDKIIHYLCLPNNSFWQLF